jgi:hypothetical protein
MVKYLDAHPFAPFTEAQLKAQNAPRDEFGVTHHNIIFNEKENKLFCLLDAPNREAVEKHHAKANVKCDWIVEVKSTK